MKQATKQSEKETNTRSEVKIEGESKVIGKPETEKQPNVSISSDVMMLEDEKPNLDNLKDEQLRVWCDNIEDAKKRILVYAYWLGKGLLQRKKELPHGTFTPWLEKALEISPRMARNYMSLAKYADEQMEQNGNVFPFSPDLPIREFLKLKAKTKKCPTQKAPTKQPSNPHNTNKKEGEKTNSDSNTTSGPPASLRPIPSSSETPNPSPPEKKKDGVSLQFCNKISAYDFVRTRVYWREQLSNHENLSQKALARQERVSQGTISVGLRELKLIPLSWQKKILAQDPAFESMSKVEVLEKASELLNRWLNSHDALPDKMHS